MNWKNVVAMLSLLACVGSASLAQDADKKPSSKMKVASKSVKHDSAWRAKHSKKSKSSAWRAKHRKHSAAWYAKHNKHDAAWYAKHRKGGKAASKKS